MSHLLQNVYSPTWTGRRSGGRGRRDSVGSFGEGRYLPALEPVVSPESETVKRKVMGGTGTTRPQETVRCRRLQDQEEFLGRDV